MSDNHITNHRVLLNKEMISRSSLNTFELSWLRLRVLFWAGFESAFLSTAGRELFFKHLFYYSQTRVLFWVFLSTFLSALSKEYIFEHSKKVLSGASPLWISLFIWQIWSLFRYPIDLELCSKQFPDFSRPVGINSGKSFSHEEKWEKVDFLKIPSIPDFELWILNLHIIICQFQKRSTKKHFFCLTPCSCH